MRLQVYENKTNYLAIKKCDKTADSHIIIEHPKFEKLPSFVHLGQC